jgi:hypothetical protein
MGTSRGSKLEIDANYPRFSIFPFDNNFAHLIPPRANNVDRYRDDEAIKLA